MLRKIPFETSEEIFNRFDLSEESAAVVAPDMAPYAVIEALDKASALPDLVNFISHALQPREAASHTHLRAHETVLELVCRLLLEKKKKNKRKTNK